VSSTLESTLLKLLGLEADAHNGVARTVVLKPILLALESTVLVVDGSVTHLAEPEGGSATHWRSRGTAGQREAKVVGQAGAAWVPFRPFSVETYIRLGKPAISLLGQLGVKTGDVG
jgi:hypothetical protein